MVSHSLVVFGQNDLGAFGWVFVAFLVVLGSWMIIKREKFRELSTTLVGVLPPSARPYGAGVLGVLMIAIAVELATGVLD